MKNVLLGLLIIGGLCQSAVADSVVGNFSGKLKNTKTKTIHKMNLKAGDYKYILKLSGNNKVKTRLRIHQDQLINKHLKGENMVSKTAHSALNDPITKGVNKALSNTANKLTDKKLLDRKGMRPDKTYKGEFHVNVRNALMKTTNKTREVRTTVSKKMGGRTLKYQLTVYKID